jgi:hypothetical protein
MPCILCGESSFLSFTWKNPETLDRYVVVVFFDRLHEVPSLDLFSFQCRENLL